MNTTHREYSEAEGDFVTVCRFLIENCAVTRRYSTWPLARFVEWRYMQWGSKLAIPEFWSQNAELWFDGYGYLAGLAISEEGGEEIAIITLEGYRFLFEEMLEWSLNSWGSERPKLSIEVTVYQESEMETLARYGFQRDSLFYNSQFALTPDFDTSYRLDDGYRIVSMKTEADYIKQNLLRRQAFAGITHLDEEETARWQKYRGHTRKSPIYHAETDLCVVAPDGTFVAACEALIDAHNLEVDIERVCTHKDYRRRGLGRAVIKECFSRVRKMGMRRAYISGYSEEAIGLYSSLGHTAQTEMLIFSRAS